MQSKTQPGPRVSRTWRIRHHSVITREIPPRSVRTYRTVGSRVWLHLCAPLTWAVANCLTTAAPQFVSRAASIPTAIPLRHRNDLGLYGSRAGDDIGGEKMQSNVRLHIVVGSHRVAHLAAASISAFRVVSHRLVSRLSHEPPQFLRREGTVTARRLAHISHHRTTTATRRPNECECKG